MQFLTAKLHVIGRTSVCHTHMMGTNYASGGQIRTFEGRTMFPFARTASQNGSTRPETNIFVRFEALTTVAQERTVFWDVTLCSVSDVAY
jgi:hypothetical protein